MDPARYQRLRDLVHAVADLPAGARRARLLALVPDDPALADEALAWLDDRGVRTEHLGAGGGGGGATPGGATPEGATADVVVPPGTRLGRYALGPEIGRGGMGIVFEGVDVETEAPVAVKVLLPHLLAVPSVRERFLREARLGRALAHEHVVRTLDVGHAEVGGRTLHWLVMERVRGRTLRRLLAEMGTVPEALVREIGRQAASGLAALHGAGVVHRDMKPENLLLTDDRRLRIMDLGVAKVLGADAGLTVEGQFVGSLHYAAPEQVAGADVGPAADLYALGTVLFELATGRPPFAGDDWVALLRAHAEVVPARLVDRVAGASEWLSELVATLLEKRPEDRFPSAEALAAAFEAGEAGPWWAARRRARPPRRPRLAVPAPTTPLVGREREVGLLAEAWAAARAGRGGLVYVEGEAGVGKSRLVDELGARVAEEDAHVLRSGFGPGAPGFRDAVAAALGGSTLEGELVRRLGVDGSAAASLAAWLRRTAPPAGTPSLGAGAADLLLGRLLRSLAADAPVLWVAEDLHAAGPDARRRAAVLARAAEGHRALLVVTTRPGGEPETGAALARLPGFAHLALARLDAVAVEALVGAVVGDTGVARRLARTIVSRADGVPLFVVELLRDLERRGVLVRAGGRMALADDGGADPAPPRPLADLVRARLAAVPPEDRAVLDAAAVEGVEFEPDLVARARGLPRLAVLEALGRLERRHGLVHSGPRRCRFDHAMLREVVHQDVPEALRAELHARLADALEATDPAPPAGERALRVLEHRLAGPEPATVRPLVSPALRHLDATGRPADGYDLALRLLAAPDVVRPDRRPYVGLYAAMCAERVGRNEAARRILDDAAADARAAGDAAAAAEVRLQQAFLALELGGFEEARVAAVEAQRHWLAGPPSNRAVEAVGVEGKALWVTGRLEEARARQEDALALATRVPHDPTVAARAQSDLAIVLMELGRHAEAEALLREAHATFAARGSSHAEINTTTNLGNALVSMGRRGEALPLYAAARARARATGVVMLEAVAAVNEAGARLALGDLEGARDAFRLAEEIARAASAPREAGYAAHGLGMVAWWSGDVAEGRRRLEAVEAERRRLGHRTGLADTLVALGALELDAGDAAAAARRLDEAAVLADEVGDPSHALVARLRRATLGPADAATVAALRARRAATRARLRLDEALESAYLLHRLAGAPEDLAEAKALLARVADLAPPDLRASTLERVPLHRAVASA